MHVVPIRYLDSGAMVAAFLIRGKTNSDEDGYSAHQIFVADSQQEKDFADLWQNFSVLQRLREPSA